MHPAFVFLPGERLTLPELTAARLDGHVVDLGEGFIPADLVETAEARAAMVRSLIPRDTAASGPTAAWIHGAGDAPPPVHHARRAVARRIRANSSPRLVVHDAALAPGEFVLIDEIAVTTPLRTLIDLALGLHRDARLGVWLRPLSQLYPGLVSEAETAVRALHRVPGIRRALHTLSRLPDGVGQDEVTR